jgi:hypothetical protein
MPTWTPSQTPGWITYQGDDGQTFDLPEEVASGFAQQQPSPFDPQMDPMATVYAQGGMPPAQPPPPPQAPPPEALGAPMEIPPQQVAPVAQPIAQAPAEERQFVPPPIETREQLLDVVEPMQQRQADEISRLRADAAAENRRLSEERRQIEERASAETEATLGRIRGMTDELKNFTVDPKRLWNEASTPAKISAAIGLFLGGLAEPYVGKNAALDIINTAIDRDIAAQRDRFTALQGGLGAEQSLYSMLRQKLGDDQAASIAARQAAADQLDLDLAAQQAQFDASGGTWARFAEMRVSLQESAAAAQAAGARQMFEDQLKIGELDVKQKQARTAAWNAAISARAQRAQEQQHADKMGLDRAKLEGEQGEELRRRGIPGAVEPDGNTYMAPTEEEAKKHREMTATAQGNYNDAEAILEILERGARAAPGSADRMAAEQAAARIAKRMLSGGGTGRSKEIIEITLKQIDTDPARLWQIADTPLHFKRFMEAEVREVNNTLHSGGFRGHWKPAPLRQPGESKSEDAEQAPAGLPPWEHAPPPTPQPFAEDIIDDPFLRDFVGRRR